MCKYLSAFALILLSTVPAATQVEPGSRLCTNLFGLFAPDDQIVGCTAVIAVSADYDGNLAYVFTSRGKALATKGDFAAALTDYGEAIKLAPTDPLVYARRADTFREMREFDRAIADYTKAINISPKSDLWYSSRALAYAGKADFRQAVADYTKALKIRPSDARFYYSRALAFYNLREFGRTVADLTQVIALDATRWDAHYWRARASRADGDTKKALADLTKAIEMNPNFVWNYIERASIYRTLGQLDLAVAALNQATRVDPNEPELKFALGITRFAMGDFAAAAQDFPATVPTPNRAYATIFRYLAKSRSGETALNELKELSAALDSTTWPYPLVQLYLGERSKRTTATLAKTSDQRCESHFYIGQWHLLRQERVQAMSELKTAMHVCTPKMVEYAATQAELKRQTSVGQ